MKSLLKLFCIVITSVVKLIVLYLLFCLSMLLFIGIAHVIDSLALIPFIAIPICMSPVIVFLFVGKRSVPVWTYGITAIIHLLCMVGIMILSMGKKAYIAEFSYTFPGEGQPLSRVCEGSKEYIYEEFKQFDFTPRQELILDNYGAIELGIIRPGFPYNEPVPDTVSIVIWDSGGVRIAVIPSSEFKSVSRTSYGMKIDLGLLAIPPYFRKGSSMPIEPKDSTPPATNDALQTGTQAIENNWLK